MNQITAAASVPQLHLLFGYTTAETNTAGREFFYEHMYPTICDSEPSFADWQRQISREDITRCSVLPSGGIDAGIIAELELSYRFNGGPKTYLPLV